MHRSMNGFWLSVALIVSVAAQSEPVDRDAIVRGIDLLTSPVLAEQTAGEAWRARYGREVILALLTRLEEDSLDRAPQTAHELTMLLSPGSAGLVARQRHFGHMRLGRFPRRTDRAANHDLAPRVRIVAQDMIARLLEQKLPSDRYSKSPSYPGHERIGSLLTLCTLLTEVGDDATVGWLMQRLVALDNRFIGEVLLGSVEGILGLPRRFSPGGMCGNSTLEEFRFFEEQEREKWLLARREAETWWRGFEDSGAAERGSQRRTRWEAYFSEHQNGMSLDAMVPLIRMGAEVLPSLEPWAAKGASQTASKAHAVIQAALLGTVDVDRLRADLVGHDTGRKLAALQLIEASGHGGFRTELLALIKTAQTSSLPATRLLASLFREDARDELQALREGGSEDSWARYALDELDAFEVRRRALDD